MSVTQGRVWIEHAGCILHLLQSSADRENYHRIRIKEIHERYCQGCTYDINDPEEQEVNNFPLVFRQLESDTIIGTIRIDLLPHNEASFRWIAIDTPYQRQGFGLKMLQAAERFVRERKRTAIRIPATSQSLPFAHHLGFTQEPWDLMPKEECMIAVCKHL